MAHMSALDAILHSQREAPEVCSFHSFDTSSQGSSTRRVEARDVTEGILTPESRFRDAVQTSIRSQEFPVCRALNSSIFSFLIELLHLSQPVPHKV